MTNTSGNGKDGGLVKSRSKLLRQEEFLREAENAGIKRTITSLCEITGVPISTVYEWFKDDEFTARWNDVPHKMIRRHLPGVMAAQLHKAIDTADTPAARLLCDTQGITKTNPNTTVVNTQINLTVSYEDDWFKVTEGREIGRKKHNRASSSSDAASDPAPSV